MKTPATPALFLALALFLLARNPHAQTITGRVLSSTGVPVSGVNIDAYDANGDEVDTANDGTNANGDFTTTILEGAGVYSIVFNPPAPPATTHLVGTRTNVVVVTTTNLGNITLGAGVLLSGRAVHGISTPVSNVTLEVRDALTQLPIPQVQTKTNAFGSFNLAVPAQPIELRLDPSSSAFVLAARRLERTPSGPLALGDVKLADGAVVSGTIQRTNGTPVSGVDLDFRLNGKANDAFVLDDNTNALGAFSCIVPVGTHTISICPKLSDLLVAQEFTGVSITTTTALGTLVLANGVQLSGTVRNASGQLTGGVDIDVLNAITGVPVSLCNDNTDGSGSYAVVVPVGTWDVRFQRSASGGSIGVDLHENVVVSGATLLNGQLPSPSVGNSYDGPIGDGGTL